ncbi:hypothetical protein LTR56_002302 [Elasticomyces elasticus]|nr:hypothetical protein LTR56_002302 [Elasticomyces elasticus]KAK3665867.1 hypothetical protein LTR22_003185 [Elasticomyces elasticus]KAK4929339.1 hypothetical protein LTR49_003942 [Elasticomyces elasticus]KAK5764628.1 hypothetical protein LTS12_005128 [Elasticomyces elasticus]
MFLRDAGALARAARRNSRKRDARGRASKKSTTPTPTPSKKVLLSKKRKGGIEVTSTPITAPIASDQTSTSPSRRRLRKRASLSPATLSRLRDPSQPARDDSVQIQESEILPTPAATTQPGSPEPRTKVPPMTPAPTSLQATHDVAQQVKEESASLSQSVIDLCDSDDDAKPAVKSDAFSGAAFAGGLGVILSRPTRATIQPGRMSRSPTAPSSLAVKRQGVDRATSRKCEEMKLRLTLAGKEREAAEKAREEAALQLEYYQMQME